MFLKSSVVDCAPIFNMATGKICFAAEIYSCRLEHKILNVIFIFCSFKVEALFTKSQFSSHFNGVFYLSLCQECEKLTGVSVAIDDQSGPVLLKANVLRMN